MIGRLHRFHGHNSLRGIYNRGKTLRGQLLTIKVAPTKQGKQYRVAVVVSKKVSKSAVVRNRIRRRLYETVRQSSGVNGTYDMVITAFSDQLADMPANELQSMFDSLLLQANSLNDDRQKHQSDIIKKEI